MCCEICIFIPHVKTERLLLSRGFFFWVCVCVGGCEGRAACQPIRGSNDIETKTKKFEVFGFGVKSRNAPKMQ